MSAPEIQPSRWKGRRWWEVIMVLLIGQLAVIFWLACSIVSMVLAASLWRARMRD